jgi:peptide/nickel transport system permease protein
MPVFALRRLVQSVPVVFLSTVGVFLLLHLVPGDPALALAGSDATPDTVRAIRTELGLDRPLPVQYALWLGRVAQGDLGVSYLNGMPVRDLLGQRIPVTLQLTVASLFVALAVAIPLGVLSAVRPRSRLSALAAGYNALAMAVPTFWLGMLLLIVFAVELSWLPAGGAQTFGRDDPLDRLRYLVLPVMTLAAVQAAAWGRYARAALLDELGREHLHTARAKGLSEAAVLVRHAAPNALPPLVALLSLEVPALVAGATVTEAVFSYPGLGRLLLTSLRAYDWPLVQGIALILAIAVVVSSLAAEVVVALADPRLRA